MVWNSESGRLLPDLAWRLALVGSVDCHSGACQARSLDTCGPSARQGDGSALQGMLAKRFRVIVVSKIFFRER
jgi:hypothetical protein